ncbi:hypothetical protein [Roseovarius salinarum]|uniref:hypothetical protein n=1 Tax=Roseovarius salinarum TaxID=1981892 RepID=UPI000C31EC5A|nr:hypothetical protein [Roseovarius salinarum]
MTRHGTGLLTALVLSLPVAAPAAGPLDAPLATAPDVILSDLLPPAEAFSAGNAAVMANDTEDGLAMTLELSPAEGGAGRPVPMMITQRGFFVGMISEAVADPSRMAADARTGAEMGLPETARCVGSVSQGNMIYCRAGESAIVQIGGSGTPDMAPAIEIAAALPFTLYDKVFPE